MLTQKEIQGLKPKASAYYVWDDNRTRGDGRLGVKVYPSGSKIFYFRYQIEGKRSFIKIGKYPEMSLSDARENSNEYKGMLKSGSVPKVELEQGIEKEKKAKYEESLKGSIEQLFKSYTSQMQKDGKRTFKAVLSALELETYPQISKETKAKDVTSHQIITILAKMIQRGAATQSNRVRSYLMAAFNYGLKHDHDPANYIEDAKFGLTVNPVAAIPKQKSAERVGENYLKINEVQTLLNDLSHNIIDFNMGKDIRNLLTLCFFTGGQRPYELVSSKFSSIDWEQKTLLITADISKNKRPHIIPLTDSAILILQSQLGNSKGSDYIFPHRFDQDKHMRTDSLAQGISRYLDTEKVPKFIARDIRRTCKTLMGELGISKSIRDRLQNHALQDVSSKHYDRYQYLKEKLIALQTFEQTLNSDIKNNILNFKQSS
jgi:integrase